VIDEDAPVWTTLQSNMQARADLGHRARFSPHWERALHAFQRYVVTNMGKPTPEGKAQ